MPRKIFKIGTRGSQLALIQTNFIAESLKAANPNSAFEIITIKTEGDTDRKSALEKMGGMGVFTKKIEQELLDGNIDIAVHSAKDLPSVMTKGLILGAVPKREVCEDVWVSRGKSKFSEIESGITVGTGSPRRRAMLLNARPDLKITDMRGNVETRLRKLDEGFCDAVIMARAGIKRSGFENRIIEVLPPDKFVPAPGQGFLAVQIRDDDLDAKSVTETINIPNSHRLLEIERELLRRLKAGCAAAVGGWARFEEEKTVLTAVVLDKNGQKRLFAEGVAESLEKDMEMVAEVSESLIDQGALVLIEQKYD